MGRWVNYEDLEEKLTLPEIMATITAIHEKEMRSNKFAAAIQGIDLDSNEEEADDVAASGNSLDMFGLGYQEGD